MANGAQFNKSKTFTDENLNDTDLNSVIDDIQNEGDAGGWGSAETTSANVQAQSDPGSYASPTVPTTIHDMIKQLRKRIADIIGGTNSSWLDLPDATIASLAAGGKDNLVGFEFDGIAGGAASTTDALAKYINQGGLLNAKSRDTADIVASDFSTSQAKFGTYSLAMDGSTCIPCVPAYGGNPVEGTLSAWFYDTDAGDQLFYNPQLGIEMYFESGAGKLECKITEANASGESAKNTVSITGASSRTGQAAWHHAALRYVCNDADGASTDSLELDYDGSNDGTALTSQDIDINYGDGGFWFCGKRNDPTWDHQLMMSGLPTAHSDAWSSNGTPGASVSNGVLNISTTSTTGYYSHDAPDVDLNQQTLEWKARLNSCETRDAANSRIGAAVQILDDSMDRSVSVTLMTGQVVIFEEAAGTQIHVADIELDTSSWHVYRLTSSGATNPTQKLFIDGLLVHEWTNNEADTTVSDHILFGVVSSSTVDVDYEYVKIYDAGAEDPITANSSGMFLDSWGIAKSAVSDTLITSLQTSRFSDVFNPVDNIGPYLPLQRSLERNRTQTITSTTFADIGSGEAKEYWFAADGVTSFKADAIMSFSHSAAGATIQMGWALDDDMSGDNASTISGFAQTTVPSGENVTIPVSRVATPSPGLHSFKLIGLTSSGTANVGDEADPQHHITITKSRKLG